MAICGCDAVIVAIPGSPPVTCPSNGVTPKVSSQIGAGTITVPTGTASSVAVTVIGGPITVTAGADPAVALPTGTSVSWGVEACTQKLSADLVFTATAPGHSFIVSWTI